MSHNNILLESGTNELEIVEFSIEEEGNNDQHYVGNYGINVAKVLEIIREPQVTKLPEVPHPSILGSFNLRGRIIPLLDLAAWLGKRLRPTTQAKAIVTEFNRVQNAFLVSGVNRIHRLSWEQIEPPDVHLSGFSGGSITGMVKIDGRIILILDMEKVIADLNPAMALKAEGATRVETEGLGHPVRVLVVDDSTMIRKTMSRGLEGVGMDVRTASDGRVAWDLLCEIRDRAAAQSKPIQDFLDVIVSDVEMPVMDGHNLTRRVKDDPVLKTLPVILFSSLISDTLRHKGESVGADEQIAKPEIATLTETIHKLLARRIADAPR